MYDWSDERLETFIRKNSKNNFVLIEFSYKQLGRSEEWFEEQCRELNYDLFKIKREILLEWNSASDLCPYTEAQITNLKKYTRDPIYSIFVDNVNQIRMFRDIDYSKCFMISCDVAAGIEQDSSTIVISDPDNNMEIVGEYSNNNIDTIEFAELLYLICKRYFKEGPIIIERNSYGKTVIDFLRKTDLEPRIYYELKEVSAQRQITDIRKSTTKQVTRVYGVNTSKESRKKMIDLLTHVINENYEYVNSKAIVSEIAGLERKKNGKIEHGSVSHDDLLMAYLFAQYVWAYGTNLNAFYIYKKRIFGDLKNNSSHYDVMDRKEAEQEFIERFNSIAMYNKPVSLGTQGLTSQTIVDNYQNELLTKQREELYQEQLKGNSNNILNMLNSFYN